MDTSKRKTHWERVYETKQDHQVSWYQEKPELSLEFVRKYLHKKEAPAIDIGGGNSRLTELLAREGYTGFSVLDISAAALERTKAKLGTQATQIKWIVSDILAFNPSEKFALWHDRATFHFLTDEKDIEKYVEIAANAIMPGGVLVLATFATSGPPKCSGLEITQYSAATAEKTFAKYFNLLESREAVHQTPFDSEQNFIYNIFERQPE